MTMTPYKAARLSDIDLYQDEAIKLIKQSAANMKQYVSKRLTVEGESSLPPEKVALMTLDAFIFAMQGDLQQEMNKVLLKMTGNPDLIWLEGQLAELTTLNESEWWKNKSRACVGWHYGRNTQHHYELLRERIIQDKPVDSEWIRFLQKMTKLNEDKPLYSVQTGSWGAWFQFDETGNKGRNVLRNKLMQDQGFEWCTGRYWSNSWKVHKESIAALGFKLNSKFFETSLYC